MLVFKDFWLYKTFTSKYKIFFGKPFKIQNPILEAIQLCIRLNIVLVLELF